MREGGARMVRQQRADQRAPHAHWCTLSVYRQSVFMGLGVGRAWYASSVPTSAATPPTGVPKACLGNLASIQKRGAPGMPAARRLERPPRPHRARRRAARDWRPAASRAPRRPASGRRRRPPRPPPSRPAPPPRPGTPGTGAGCARRCTRLQRACSHVRLCGQYFIEMRRPRPGTPGTGAGCARRCTRLQRACSHVRLCGQYFIEMRRPRPGTPGTGAGCARRCTRLQRARSHVRLCGQYFIEMRRPRPVRQEQAPVARADAHACSAPAPMSGCAANTLLKCDARAQYARNRRRLRAPMHTPAARLLPCQVVRPILY